MKYGHQPLINQVLLEKITIMTGILVINNDLQEPIFHIESFGKLLFKPLTLYRHFKLNLNEALLQNIFSVELGGS